MSNTLHFARKTGDMTRRELRFIATLQRNIAVHLPEALRGGFEVTPKMARWRTMRLRPEITAAVEALQARYTAQHNGRELTASEVLAAALTEALPLLAARDFRSVPVDTRG